MNYEMLEGALRQIADSIETIADSLSPTTDIVESEDDVSVDTTDIIEDEPLFSPDPPEIKVETSEMVKDFLIIRNVLGPRLIDMSSTKYILMSNLDSVDLSGLNNVAIDLNGYRISRLNIGNINGLSVWDGSVGTIYNDGGAVATNVLVRGVSMDGPRQGESFNVSVNNLHLDEVTAKVDRYSVWCDDSRNILVENCELETYDTGSGEEEACTRFVCVSGLTMRNNVLKSNLKHCFRVHGLSSDILFEGNTCIGAWFMFGIEEGRNGLGVPDQISNIRILNNSIVLEQNDIWMSLGPHVDQFTYSGNRLYYDGNDPTPLFASQAIGEMRNLGLSWEFSDNLKFARSAWVL